MISIGKNGWLRIGWGACLLAVLLVGQPAGAAAQSAGETPWTLDEVLGRVEKRYAGPGFTADFYQESTLKEMDVTDTAEGKIYVKRPGMMRWEYQKPEKQTIVTDSDKLWIYRPEDNQLVVGEAPTYFGQGKGAGFLSDMKQIRKNFTIRLEISDDPGYVLLKLVPVRKSVDVTEIYLSISKQAFEIEKIVTFNAFGDRTRITLSHIDFKRVLDDSAFRFAPPKGADILKMDR